MCGSPNPFDLTQGLGNGRGYHGGAWHSRTGEGGGFSLGGLVKDMVIGGIVGGLGSAGFYGAGKALDALKESFIERRNNTPISKSRRADFYVAPNGDVIPATGYRYLTGNTSVIQNAKKGYMDDFF